MNAISVAAGLFLIAGGVSCKAKGSLFGGGVMAQLALSGETVVFSRKRVGVMGACACTALSVVTRAALLDLLNTSAAAVSSSATGLVVRVDTVASRAPAGAASGITWTTVWQELDATADESMVAGFGLGGGRTATAAVGAAASGAKLAGATLESEDAAATEFSAATPL